ncbi:MAG: hypothetical protein ACM3N7_04140 [Planctomycetaceae bacterium]
MKKSLNKRDKDIMRALRDTERARREEELTRPRVEIWADPEDDWAEWVRSHERRKMGNPVDLCEIALRMRASPLCSIGYH